MSAVHQLSREDLITILTEPRNALVKQFQRFFEFDGIELVFSDDALNAVADKALERETGARGLRSIIEEILLDVQFELPSRRDVKKCVVTKETIEKGIKPTLVTEAVADDGSALGRRRLGVEPRRPADPIAFAGGALDRAGHLRTDDAWLEVARRDPAARAIAVGREGAHPEPVALRDGDEEPIFLGLGHRRPAVRRRARRPAADRAARPGDVAARRPARRRGLRHRAGQLARARIASAGAAARPTGAREGGHVRVCDERPPAPSAHRPGRDHARHRRRPRAARPPGVAGRRAATARWPGSSSRARRSRTAVAREVREEAGVEVRDVALRRLAAVAVPGLADARLPRDLRGRRAGARRRRARGRALVHARRAARSPRATTSPGSTGRTPTGCSSRRRWRSRGTCWIAGCAG